MDSRDVAQLVIRYEEEDGYRYLLAKRTSDGYWEWIGGKREEGETIEEAALRELDEELASIEPEDVEIKDIADPYPSEADPRFLLNPVLMEMPREKALEIDEQDLSKEHFELEWVELGDFDDKKTLGQRPALEQLGIIPEQGPQGDVVVGVTKNEEKGFLVVRRSEHESFPGFWEFPGGGVEADEDLEEAVIREVEEETGLDAEILENGESYTGEGSTGPWRLHPFLVKLDGGEVDLSHEHDRYRWIEIEEIHDLKTYGHLRALKTFELI